MQLTERETTITYEIRGKLAAILTYRGTSLEQVDVQLAGGPMRQRNKISIRGEAIQLVHEALDYVVKNSLELPAAFPPQKRDRPSASLAQEGANAIDDPDDD